MFFTSPINSAILAVFAINNKFQSTLYLTIVHSIVVPKMAIKIEHKWKIDILTQIGQRENCFPALKEPAEFSLSSIPHLFVLQKKQHSIQKFWMEGGNDAATIYCIVCMHYIALGKVSWGKTAVLLDFVQNTSLSPHLDNLYKDLKGSLGLKILYILYNILYIYNLKPGLMFKLLYVLEEIDSFYWPKMHLWRGAKKFGQGPPPPPHLDKIQ